MALLVFVHFISSIAVTWGNSEWLNLDNVYLASYSVFLFIEYECVLLLFGVNFLLGLERFVSIRYPELTERESKKYFDWFLGVTAVNCAVQGLSNLPCEQESLCYAKHISWSITMGAYILGVVLATIALYTTTFLHVRKQLLTSQGIPNVSAKIKAVRTSCFLMAGSFFICYVPSLLMVFIGAHTTRQTIRETRISDLSAALILTLDSTITPTLVLYFWRDLRLLLMSRFCGEGNKDAEKKDTVDATENSHFIT
ncbi:hypothetical protein BDR26DRAFT_677502 [Obelidium mucronatum]|nr:hypothetical protein BDR26DRAFT_677502 [Obelidium mucronatum]